ncbi:MAG: hypothetical protein KC501_34665, partial [Myxococcales bacterium]|nr:hypothetical protein [Myxococcales bacterium]
EQPPTVDFERPPTVDFEQPPTVDFERPSPALEKGEGGPSGSPSLNVPSTAYMETVSAAVDRDIAQQIHEAVRREGRA